jgi:hypothetical protein
MTGELRLIALQNTSAWKRAFWISIYGKALLLATEITKTHFNHKTKRQMLQYLAHYLQLNTRSRYPLRHEEALQSSPNRKSNITPASKSDSFWRMHHLSELDLRDSSGYPHLRRD